MSPSNPETEYSAALKKLMKKFSKLEHDLDRREDDDAFQFDKAPPKLLSLLTEACTIVRRARNDTSVDLMPVLELADEAIGEMVDLAYGERELYEFLPSFAHDDASPKIDDPEPRSIGAGAFGTLLPIMMKMAGLQGDQDIADFKSKMNIPKAYDSTFKPHERTTPLARFRKGVTTEIGTDTPVAQAVYQARCSIMSDSICSPIQLTIASDSSCLALAAAGPFKNRSPMLSFYLLDSTPEYDEFPEEVVVDVGLSNVAREVTMDDKRKLIYIADGDRIKSYAYGLGENGTKWLPKHTLGGQNGGPIALMNNGSQILRSGNGTVDIWNVDALPDHGTNGKKRIGDGIFSIENSWRDGSDEMELSTGSEPDSKLNLTDSELNFACWYPYTTHSPSWILGAPEDTNSCIAIDLQAGGRTAARFIGHGGHINSFSSSDGDSNTFITACNDGLVRLFDVREPLPCLSFDAGAQSETIQSALIVHVQGIPLVISGGQESEQIKVWDPRARKLVYELATGNNNVNSLAWDGPRSTLYAATECRYMDRLGYHHGYRRARKPHQGGAGFTDEDERWWPEKAHHDESHFGHALDSGDHCLFRYAFGTDAHPDVFPVYGSARPLDSM